MGGTSDGCRYKIGRPSGVGVKEVSDGLEMCFAKARPMTNSSTSNTIPSAPAKRELVRTICVATGCQGVPRVGVIVEILVYSWDDSGGQAARRAGQTRASS